MDDKRKAAVPGTVGRMVGGLVGRHKWVKDERYGLPICAYCGHVLRRDNSNRDNECPGQVRVVLRGTCGKCGKPRLDCRCHFGTVAMQNMKAEAPK